MSRLAVPAKRPTGLVAGAILLMTAIAAILSPTAIAATADQSPAIKSHPESYINADGSVSKDKAARILKKRSDTVQHSTANLK